MLILSFFFSFSLAITISQEKKKPPKGIRVHRGARGTTCREVSATQKCLLRRLSMLWILEPRFLIRGISSLLPTFLPCHAGISPHQNQLEHIRRKKPGKKKKKKKGKRKTRFFHLPATK
ncbi:hypothetical protein ACKS0A_02527 [Histoplasma ohiense]